MAKNGKGICYWPWINLTDVEILIKYRSIIMGYKNYYLLADNFSRIEYVTYLLRFSAIHTLAAKYKQSIAKIMTKYGNWPKVIKPDGQRYIDLKYEPKVVPVNFIADNSDPLKICNFK
jgi:hypothetical protein